MGAAAIISIAGPMIGSLVGFVERKFGARKGPQKLKAVVSAAHHVLAGMKESGEISDVPTEDDVVRAVEPMVQGMRAEGKLNGAATSDNCTITIPRGSKITIEVP